MKGIRGWFLVYIAASIPVTLFFAAGLAGRFFDYHPGAIAVFFVVLAVPLALAVFRSPSAPAWNIVSLWIGSGSISVILLYAACTVDEARLREVAATMAVIAFASITWAVVWTMYLLRSEYVATTFGQRRPFHQSRQ